MEFNEFIDQEVKKKLDGDEKYQQLTKEQKECDAKAEELGNSYDKTLWKEFGLPWYWKNAEACNRFFEDYPERKAELEKKTEHSLRKNHWKEILKNEEARYERLMSNKEKLEEKVEAQKRSKEIAKEIEKIESSYVRAVVRENKENPIVENAIMEAIRLSINGQEKQVYDSYRCHRGHFSTPALNYIVDSAKKVVVKTLYQKQVDEAKVQIALDKELDEDEKEVE